ncbi:MAG: PilZ domain-containing protein [Acidobacteria bacterium]|nr:PilZ domain-containing protein [Acidobacteriota bacterium]
MVRLIGAPKPTNLRRFVRVRTHKAARLAPFPFVDDRPADEVPQFVAGTLTEMGGPGLRIEAPIELSKGSRVLLMIELDGTHSLRATGLVRRSSMRNDGMAEVGLEIVGLNDEQIADLVKATHAAAQDAGIDLTLMPEAGEVPAEAAQGRTS